MTVAVCVCRTRDVEPPSVAKRKHILPPPWKTTWEKEIRSTYHNLAEWQASPELTCPKGVP